MKASAGVAIVLAPAFALALALSACDRADRGERRSGAATRDEVGRVVVPRATPTRRIVSLAPNITELLFAIGAEAELVGIDRYSDQPAGRVERLPKVGTNYEPSLEMIVALHPDVVFLSKSANRRETADALERMGVPVYITSTPALGDVARTLRDVGVLTGHAREAETEVARIEAGFARLRARVRGLPRPRVLVAVWADPLYVAGRETFTHDLVELAGGENVTAEVSGFAKFPIERVLRLAPEVIILPTHATDAPEANSGDAIAYWNRWSSLPAVRAGHVFAIEDSIISRPGARLVEGAERLARLVHPGLAARP